MPPSQVSKMELMQARVRCHLLYTGIMMEMSMVSRMAGSGRGDKPAQWLAQSVMGNTSCSQSKVVNR